VYTVIASILSSGISKPGFPGTAPAIVLHQKFLDNSREEIEAFYPVVSIIMYFFHQIIPIPVIRLNV
jgi:hypothetical protein